MALSWWIRKIGSSWSEELAAIVDDVTWVMMCIGRDGAAKETQGTPASPSKRAHQDGNDDAPTRSSGRQVKRCVLFVFHRVLTD
jgi:hypothetical protein